jgi:UDP-hydrolysing UDP-N-acetyl-D-glucosamine 2-epimerase
MSTLHFTAAKPYRRRVVQLGEQPDRVFNAGALGAENIMILPPVRSEELSADIGFDTKQPFVLCTYHPETLGVDDPLYGLNQLLDALDALDLRCLFTAANADRGGAAINERLTEYCAARADRALLVKSLGVRRYLSAMRYCTAVVGNSSSAIVEAPTLHKPAVNIGDRQKGRMMGDNTLCCPAERADIEAALSKAVSPEFVAACRDMESPFGEGETSRIILREIKTALLQGMSMKKTFFDIAFDIER